MGESSAYIVREPFTMIEEAVNLQLIVHFPDSPQEMAELRVRTAATHARAVSRLLEKMGCTQEQRREMIRAIGAISTDLPPRPSKARRRSGSCGRET